MSCDLLGRCFLDTQSRRLCDPNGRSSSSGHCPRSDSGHIYCSRHCSTKRTCANTHMYMVLQILHFCLASKNSWCISIKHRNILHNNDMTEFNIHRFTSSSVSVMRKQIRRRKMHQCKNVPESRGSLVHNKTQTLGSLWRICIFSRINHREKWKAFTSEVIVSVKFCLPSWFSQNLKIPWLCLDFSKVLPPLWARKFLDDIKTVFHESSQLLANYFLTLLGPILMHSAIW